MARYLFSVNISIMTSISENAYQSFANCAVNTFLNNTGNLLSVIACSG